jgi:uncharacterized membrane protein
MVSEQSQASARTPNPILAFLRGWILFVPLLPFVFACSWNPIGCDDVWCHAAVGRWIFKNHAIPHHALFLWTSHAPWIAHSWLSELIIYFLMRGGSDQAAATRAIIGCCVLGVISFAVLWRYWLQNRIPALVSLLLFIVGVIASHDRFQPRAEMFTAVLFTLELVLISRFFQSSSDADLDLKNKKRAAFCFPLLFLFWVNLHGMFAYGIAFAILALIGAFLDKRPKNDIKLVGAALLASLIIIGVNPYGYTIWKAVAGARSEMFTHIIEWEPLFVPPAIDYQEFYYLIALLGLAVCAIALNKQRRITDMLFIVFECYLNTTARRYNYMSILLLLWVIGSNLMPAYEALKAKENSFSLSLPIKLGVYGFSGILICLWLYSMWPSGKQSFITSPLQSTLPVEQANWILSHRITGNIMNDYDNASYLEWRFENGPLLAIDTLNAYPESVFQLCGAFSGADPKAMQYFSSVKLVIGRRPHSFDKALPLVYYYLHADLNWQEVFVGDSGPIWVRMPEGQKRTWLNPHWVLNDYIRPMPDK